MWTGRPVADRLAALGGRIGVEHGGEEDRRAGGVEVEDLGRVGREPEAVVGRPLADLGRAAAQDGHVEGVDADLHELLGRVGRRGSGRVGGERRDAGSVSRMRRWSVQSPPFSTLDGIPGSGVERAERPAAAGELEGRDVVLVAVVVARRASSCEAG